MANEVKLAALSESMIEGTITHWYKKVGETVKIGDLLLDVETDKANAEVTSHHSGTLLKILVSEGEVVPIGALLAVIGEPGEEIQDILQGDTTEFSNSNHIISLDKSPSRKEIPQGHLNTSPVARRIAREHNINLEEIQGTGPKGLITANDVKSIVSSRESRLPSKRDVKYGREEIIPLEGRRRVIAEKLALSKRTVADLTTFVEVDVTEMMVLRRESNITVTTYIARAVVEGLKEYPALNSSLLDENIIIKYYINLGIAVDLEEGLVVPVMHNVQDKNLLQIAKELSELTQKAHDGKLSRENLEGGTFTISNSGVLGSSFFTPIINYPEGAILGMGKIERKPVVVGEEIVIRQMMYLAVTYDHRIIDGGTAVRFLQSVKNHLEDPVSIN